MFVSLTPEVTSQASSSTNDFWIPVFALLVAAIVAITAVHQVRQIKRQNKIHVLVMVIEDLSNQEARDDRHIIYSEEVKGMLSDNQISEAIERTITRMDRAGYLLLECAGVKEQTGLFSCFGVKVEPPLWIWEMTDSLWTVTKDKVHERRQGKDKKAQSQYARYFEELLKEGKKRGRSNIESVD